MSDTSDRASLHKDQSLRRPEEDKLGYDTFSEELALSIQNEVPQTAFVIGIYGEWGSGKSSILNFVEYYLKQSEESPLIVRFNPWWFSGQEDLTSKYFDELGSALSTEGGFDKLRGKLHKFSTLISHVPSSATGGIPIDAVGKMGQYLFGDPNPTLSELKIEISESIKELEQPIVVFIDDIDRLTQDEIRQMFRLVKSVADFPNVIYVMAFDQSVVIDALEGEQRPGNGEEYLNKIIQLPQHVPVPESGALYSLLVERLSLLTQGTEQHMDESRWQVVFNDGIFPIINTPRDTVRLSNAIAALDARIGEEVNFVDMAAVETLRIFFRPVFEEIRANKSDFVIQQGNNDADDDQFSFLDEIYDDLDSQKEAQIRVIVGHLFPQFGTRASALHVSDLGQYRRRKRICHPDMYAYFFRQTVPRGEIAAAEMDSMLSLTGDRQDFAHKLSEFTEQEGKRGQSKATTFLNQFEDYINQIPDEDIEDVLCAISLVGDELISADPSKSVLDNGARGPLLRITWNLIRRIEKDHRQEPLEHAIERGNSVYLPFYFVGVMMQEHGKYGGEKKESEDRTFSQSQIESLKDASVQKAEELADSDELLKVPNLHFVLTRWHEWGDETEVQSWSKTTFGNLSNLLTLLNDMVQVGRSSSRTRTTETEYINPENLEPFLEISAVRRQIDNIDIDDLEESDRRIVNLFQDGVARIDQGIDPGNFGEWSSNRQ